MRSYLSHLSVVLGSTVAVMLTLADRPAASADLTWSGNVEVDYINCEKKNIGKIIISGEVTLVHPRDKDPFGDVKKISIFCPLLQFEKDSSLSSISILDIRISDTTSGPVVITNTRGATRGKDGGNPPYTGNNPAEDIWVKRVGADGGKGGSGGDGRDGSGCALINDHDSDPGGPGGTGQGGQQGGDLKVAGGEPGQNGVSAADVILISTKFAKGTTIDITANGGDGGNGGMGGRGADGGRGGQGGYGGHGGDASSCHTASRGGDGGTGGKGGDGGNGGAGGDGGNGGNGATVTVLKEDGGPVPPLVATFNGGRGGRGGLGGEPGAGGPGGEGGIFGWGGGSHKGLIPGIEDHGQAGTGNNGANGDPGKPGQAGPLGHNGDDGSLGHLGKGLSGSVTKDQLKDLLPAMN
ncbi:hypothetical protein EN850_02950 [Mesorhizobium sp. M8A.F.Ca.ET.207.01.1.1]|uniref:hypothetical protein n=1 Tax=Mesorhizobium sp. M8A.F.Ca.ET.207.01.1.1 TaxID=2563968 RepID=UPI00109C0466|nr:hypothetical protein [Mesorhizobium sp. M8A.F.Ca.ET.207.01.1.1]TGQ83717.1 hypothetical protein EN850_02950 [Mesorhizobium sp. M8A.F.Ca.ET.207.01.1.1]